MKLTNQSDIKFFTIFYFTSTLTATLTATLIAAIILIILIIRFFNDQSLTNLSGAPIFVALFYAIGLGCELLVKGREIKGISIAVSLIIISLNIVAGILILSKG